MSADHISTWTEDEDGWPVIVCSCGWETPGLPDAETAGDVWGGHLLAVVAAGWSARLTEWRGLMDSGRHYDVADAIDALVPRGGDS